MMIDNYHLTCCPRLHKHMADAALRHTSAKNLPLFFFFLFFPDNGFLMSRLAARARTNRASPARSLLQLHFARNYCGKE